MIKLRGYKKLKEHYFELLILKITVIYNFTNVLHTIEFYK